MSQYAAPQQSCPDCAVELGPIRIVDKTHGSDADMEYSLYGTEKTFWTGFYPRAGKVMAYMCPQCRRILLYGEPNG